MNRKSVVPLLAGLLAVAIAGGCNQQQNSTKPEATNAAKPVGEAAISGPPPAECRKFADELAQAVESGSLQPLNQKIDWPALLARATAGVPAPPDLQKEFIERGLQAADEDRGFSARLVETIKDGGTLKFLRVHNVLSERRILFRLVRKDGGLGYFDFVLGGDPAGHVRVVDVDVVQDGQLLSKMMRETYLQTLVTKQPTIVTSLAGEDHDLAEVAPQLFRMAGLRKSGHFREAMNAFDELPRAVRSRKTMQRLHVAVAEGIGGQEYTDALEQFRSRFPDDPSAELLSADYYLRTKQFDKAAGCIHRLDVQVDDPYLDVMLARLYLQAGDPAAARKTADAAIRRAPRDLDSYQARLSVSLAEKKFADTARLLHFIGTRFGAQFHDLKTLPAYAEFVKSPEYDEWLKAQAETRKQANNK